MSKPRILVFIDWYLPGFKAGGPVRSVANLVDRLRDRVDFHIVTRNTDYTETVPYPGIGPDRWTTLPGGEKVWYASAQGTGRKAWNRLLKEEAWDAVYINGMYSWWYSILPLWMARRTSAMRVVAVRGMLASGAMQHGAVKKLLFLTMARVLDLYRNVRFQATNAEEARDVKLYIHKHADVHVVPNLARKAAVEVRPVTKEQGAVKLLSIARIAVEKNTLVAIESLRKVTGRVTFHIYGAMYDEAYWARCREAIGRLPANVEVVWKGTVPPEQVHQVLAEHHALFMPSAGENFGHTMLESLCAGRPLLISDRTPWRNLEADHAGWDLPLDRPGAFSEAVESMSAMDQAEYNAWSAGASERGKRYLADEGPVEASLKLFQP